MYEPGQPGTPEEFQPLQPVAPPVPSPADIPPAAAAGYQPVGTGMPNGTYNAAGSAYPPPAGTYGTPGQYPPAGTQPGTYSVDGLGDNAAGAIAYITIIPAVLFLVLAPYNQRPFVKFHAFQCLGLAVAGICLSIIGVIPILGWIAVILGSVALMIVWVLCIVKASQGSALKLPVISKLASEQSGYLP